MNTDRRSKLLQEIKNKHKHINLDVANDWLISMESDLRCRADREALNLTDAELESYVDRNLYVQVKQLGSFKSFDIGVLYIEHMGGFCPFDVNARDVISSKLCLSTPPDASGNMERGKHIKQFAMQKFEHKMKSYGLKNNQEAYDKLKSLSLKEDRKHGWLNPYPGAIYTDKNNETWVVSFKSPVSEESFDDLANNPADYIRAQLAYEKLGLEEAGVKVDHTVIVPFSLSSWDIAISEITISHEMMTDVLSAGDKYWAENVLKNELPQPPMSKNFEHITEVPDGFQDLLMSYMLTKKMESMSKSKGSVYKNKILKMASLNGVNWDIEDMKTRIAGIDISTKPRKSVDKDAVIADLKAGKDVNPKSEDYVSYSNTTTVSLVRSKNSPYSGLIEEMESIAQRCFDFAEDDMRASAGFTLTEDKINSMVTDPSSPLYGKLDEVHEIFADLGYSVTADEDKANVHETKMVDESFDDFIKSTDDFEPIF